MSIEGSIIARRVHMPPGIKKNKQKKRIFLKKDTINS